MYSLPIFVKYIFVQLVVMIYTPRYASCDAVRYRAELSSDELIYTQEQAHTTPLWQIPGL